MARSKRAWLTTVVLFPVISAAQTPADTAATPISLSEAISLAQRNAPATVQARGAIQTSELTVKQAYSAFLPTVNVSAATTRQKGDRFDAQGNLVPFTGQPASYSTGLNANLQLFDGGRRLFDLRKTKAHGCQTRKTRASGLPSCAASKSVGRWLASERQDVIEQGESDWRQAEPEPRADVHGNPVAVLDCLISGP